MVNQFSNKTTAESPLETLGEARETDTERKSNRICKSLRQKREQAISCHFRRLDGNAMMVGKGGMQQKEEKL